MKSNNFPNLQMETDTEVQEAQRVPKKDNPKEIHNKTHYI